MGVRVSWDECADWGVCYDRIYYGSEDHEDAYQCYEECSLGEMYVEYEFVGLMIYQRKTELGRSAVFVFFAHIFS